MPPTSDPSGIEAEGTCWGGWLGNVPEPKALLIVSLLVAVAFAEVRAKSIQANTININTALTKMDLVSLELMKARKLSELKVAEVAEDAEHKRAVRETLAEIDYAIAHKRSGMSADEIAKAERRLGDMSRSSAEPGAKVGARDASSAGGHFDPAPLEAFLAKLQAQLTEDMPDARREMIEARIKSVQDLLAQRGSRSLRAADNADHPYAGAYTPDQKRAMRERAYAGADPPVGNGEHPPIPQ